MVLPKIARLVGAALLATAGCIPDPEPPAAWETTRITGEGREQVEIRRQREPSLKEPTDRYAVRLSRDGGDFWVTLLEGRTTKLDRRLRVYRLGDGSWAATEGTHGAIANRDSQVTPFDFWRRPTRGLGVRHREVLGRLVREPGLDDDARDRAAIALGFLGDPDGAAALRERLAEREASGVGRSEAVRLRAHLARVTGDTQAIADLRRQIEASDRAATFIAEACVPALRPNVVALASRTTDLRERAELQTANAACDEAP